MKKRLLVTLLAFTMTVSSLAGCGAAKEETASENAADNKADDKKDDAKEDDKEDSKEDSKDDAKEDDSKDAAEKEYTIDDLKKSIPTDNVMFAVDLSEYAGMAIAKSGNDVFIEVMVEYEGEEVSLDMYAIDGTIYARTESEGEVAYSSCAADDNTDFSDMTSVSDLEVPDDAEFTVEYGVDFEGKKYDAVTVTDEGEPVVMYIDPATGLCEYMVGESDGTEMVVAIAAIDGITLDAEFDTATIEEISSEDMAMQVGMMIMVAAMAGQGDVEVEE